jgi:hypothetical protein
MISSNITISMSFVEDLAGRDHIFTTWARASGPPTFPATKSLPRYYSPKAQSSPDVKIAKSI